MPPPPTPQSVAPPASTDITVTDLIRQEATKAGVPPELALAVGEQESHFDPTSIGRPLPSGVRALGTMQLLPETATRFGVDINDPVQNIRGGVSYLKELLDQHQGDLSKVLADYGGVSSGNKTSTYVPEVLGRMGKFSGPPTAASGTPPPSTPHPSSAAVTPPPKPTSTTPPEVDDNPSLWQATKDFGSALFGHQTQRLVAGAAGAAAAGALAPVVGLPVAAGGVLGLAARSLPPILGAAAGGAGAAAAQGTDIAEGAKEQAGYETFGQALGGLINKVGRRAIAGRVGKQAATALAAERAATESTLADTLSKAEATVQAHKDRFAMTAPQVSPATAGKLTNAAIQGPAKSALDQVGEAVESSAKSGPALPTAPLKARLDDLADQITPLPSELPQSVTMAVSGNKLSPELTKKFIEQLGLEPEHPLPAVLNKLRSSLAGVEEIPFEDAHKIKRTLDDAVNWDSPAKKQAQQITKAIRNTLRDLMAVHEPYNAATATYADTVQLHRKGIAPQLQKQAVANPESLVKLIKPDEPTKLQMLKDLLLTEAPKGGGKTQGEAAWNATRAAWTHERLIKGLIEKLPDRIAKMDPTFREAMFGDPQGKAILSNLQQIADGFTSALEKETVAGSAVKAGQAETPAESAFKTSTLASDKQATSGRQAAISAAHVMLFPHSPFTPVRIGEVLVRGPQVNDLVTWAVKSDAGTRLLVRALASPAPGMAVADLLRWKQSEEETPLAVSHTSSPTGGPPIPTTSRTTGPPPVPSR